MNPGRVIVSNDDVAAVCRQGNLTLGRPDKWPEAGEDLDHVSQWIVHLGVTAA